MYNGKFALDQTDGLTPQCRRTANNQGTNDGAWHLWSWSKDTSNHPNGITLYLDGVNINDDTSTTGTGVIGTNGHTADFVVGGYDIANPNPNPQRWKGKVCHSFLFDVELTASDHAAIYGNGSPQDLSALTYAGGTTFANVVHWAALGDGDAVGADNMLDLSGNANDGTYTNGDPGDFVADVPSGGAHPSASLVGYWDLETFTTGVVDMEMVNMDAGDFEEDTPG
jgi:hypothetical protein